MLKLLFIPHEGTVKLLIQEVDICQKYIEPVEDGYTLTVDEVASYLRCTYQHVIDKLVPEISHIRITETSKMLLLKYVKVYDLDDILGNISSLFYKRILFHQGDFQEFICKNPIPIISYKRLYMDDFDPKIMEEIKGKLHN